MSLIEWFRTNLLGGLTDRYVSRRADILLVHARKAGEFRGPHTVNLHQLAADVRPQPLGLVLLVVLDDYFEEQIGAMHIPLY